MPTLRENLRALPREAWILYAGTFINRFGSFVMVFLVAWMTSRGHSAASTGLALGGYGIGHLIASIAGGYLTDTIGRRSTIALSMFSAALAVLALSQAETLPAIILCASLTGLTAELYRPASGAMLADLTPQGSRLTAFAVYRLAINLGFAAGPAVAGLLAERSFLYLFIGDAVTSVIFGVIALTMLPDRSSSSPEQQPRGEFLRGVVGDRRFLMFLFASVLTTMVFFQAESTFPLHVLASGYDSRTYGMLISFNGLLIVLFELWLTSVTQRFRPSRVIAFGFLLVGAGFAMNAFAHTIPVFLVVITIWTFGEITSAPVGSAYVADLAPAHLRGSYMGAWSFTWSVGLILGPVLGTYLFQHEPNLLWLSCAAIGVVSALLVLKEN